MSSEQAAEAFVGVEQTLAAVESHLAVLHDGSLEEFLAPLTPLERAKVQVSLGTLDDCVLVARCAADSDVGAAYAVNALLYVFLKTQGVSAKDIRQTHVKQELVCLWLSLLLVSGWRSNPRNLRCE